MLARDARIAIGVAPGIGQGGAEDGGGDRHDQGKLNNIQQLIGREINNHILPEHLGEAPEFKTLTHKPKKKGKFKSKSWKTKKSTSS